MRGPARQIGLLALLRRSLLYRRARSLSALVALTVSAAVATALFTLYADLDRKLHHEFRSFGANVILTAPALPPETIAQARKAAGPEALAAVYAYAVATTDRSTPVVIAGVDFAQVRALNSTWQVTAWPSAPDSILLGSRAADFVANEHQVALTFAGATRSFPSAGRLTTGAEEDSRIYLPLAAFTAFTQVQPSVLELQIAGGAPAVDAAIARLHAALPQARIEPVRQLVQGESGIVEKTHALMFGAVLLIALTVAVSVLATLSASVLERRRDFALMKALGGSDHHLMRLFVLETLVLALGGVLAGYLLGSLAAYAISQWNFHTATLPRLSVLPLVVLLNALIASLAAFFPVRSLRQLRPALVLKGE